MTPSPETLYATVPDMNSENFAQSDVATFACRICKIAKPLSEYSKNKREKRGHDSRCKGCAVEYYKELERKHAGAENLPTEKSCSMCHITKPMDSFYKAGWSADGRHTRCKECLSFLAAEHWKRSPDFSEERKRKNREWREENKEYVAEMKKSRSTDDTRERARILAFERRRRDPEKARAIHRDWNHRRWEFHATQNCKVRAKRKSVPFSMQPSDLLKENGILPEFCPIFPHIRLDYNGGHDRRCWPSVDRIVPELGYITGNVWVTSIAANVWKNNGSNPAERRRIIALMGGAKPKEETSNQAELFD